MSMVNGRNTWPLKAFASGNFLGSVRFRPNAAATPTVLQGNLAGGYTVAYAATGLYTVTFSIAGLKMPVQPTIVMSSACADNTNTNRFQVHQVGDWNNTTRSFVIQARQEGTAFAVPNDAANWIQAFIMFQTQLTK